VVEGAPQGNPAITYPSVNSGFVYENQSDPKAGQYTVMSYFKWGSMKVFHKLAKEFVVCDNWFCDMPGHTTPNRAFMHCATTGLLGIDDDNQGNLTYPIPAFASMVYQPTIFQNLEEAGKTWKMYWPGSNLDTDFLNLDIGDKMWTGLDTRQSNCTGVPLDQFCADAKGGYLPFYSFIMCWNDIGPDTSMHPSSPVEPGENLLAGIYNTLRNSPHWEDTLLVVNFDENGGIYDHVTPPKTTPPYPGAAPQTWTTSSGKTYEFDYSVLGVRIPVMLISPWLNKGIDSNQFQNTSILRFLQDMTNPLSSLTGRDQNAPGIEQVFEDFGSTEMRKDCIENLETYPGTTFSNGICASIMPTKEQLDAAPIPYLEEITKEYIAGLPGHPDSGKSILTRHFATVSEMRSYVEERRNAARTYHKRF
jgi:phospholipase C